MDEIQMMYKEMAWRGILTMLIMAGTLVGALGYVAFYSTGFTLFQKFAVVLIALVVAGVITGIVWMAGWSRYMNKKAWTKFRSWKK